MKYILRQILYTSQMDGAGRVLITEEGPMQEAYVTYVCNVMKRGKDGLARWAGPINN